ncbi:MAG: indole-3-glycerol-phosphate synthase [Coriobacteriia bacterium]|nr:indole-3-glycerol-phosphate synthase [Coriobacteriia bacterium]
MSFLETIIAHRLERIGSEYGSLETAELERIACCARPVRDFESALREAPSVAVIAEVKKASPSAGPIAPECEASERARQYRDGGAVAISVLTEPEYFGGSFTDLSDVSDAVDVPVLCKDFVVDPVQLSLARGHGADAVLLMVSVLGSMVPDYLKRAATLGLKPLVEVADLDELYLALGAGATLVGVNARDFRTLEVDLRRQREIVAEASRSGVTVVAASGVKNRADVVAASECGADAVLVGETLMRSPFPEDSLVELTGVKKGRHHE